MYDPNSNPKQQTDPLCTQVSALLPEYNENSLPTHKAWEVEKHLMACGSCAQVARELTATVQLLRASASFDTGHDFMAKLHARLDSVEPEPARPWRQGLQEWFAALRQPLQVRRLPMLGVGAAAAACVIFLLARPAAPDNTPSPAGPAAPPIAHVIAAAPRLVDQQHTALAASNPFDDPVAAQLQAQSGEDGSDAASDVQ